MRGTRDGLVSKLGRGGENRVGVNTVPDSWTEQKKTDWHRVPPSNANHFFLLVLGSATTVNGATILVSTVVPEAKEAQNAFAQ